MQSSLPSQTRLVSMQVPSEHLNILSAHCSIENDAFKMHERNIIYNNVTKKIENIHEFYLNLSRFLFIALKTFQTDI